MRHDLVGFVVGALEANEYEEVRQKLEQDPELQQHLSLIKRGLEPLDWDKQTVVPPSGLASRTCEFIANLDASGKTTLTCVQSDGSLTPASQVELSGGARRWTMADFVVAAGVCLAAACLFFPAIVNSRYHSQLTICQNKMKGIGQALVSYSQTDERGMFPAIPTKGKLSVAGYYAPTLVENGFVEDADLFYCPAKSHTVVLRIPHLKDVLTAEGNQLVSFHRSMGGDYAYTLGYTQNGQLHGIRNQDRTHFPVLSDEPQEDLPNSVISSHGRGQNVLFEDSHVAFISTRQRPGAADDDIFRNYRGVQQAGIHSDDAVLAPSAVTPVSNGPPPNKQVRSGR
jgi:hypothetical protein